jgi:Putative bacterial virulence factor
MNHENDAVLKFARDLRKTVQAMSKWADMHREWAEKKGVRRAELQLDLGKVDRLIEALGWGVSVGMYGESQCGKSNLVSRLAYGLGAVTSPDGGLCIADPFGAPHTGTPAKPPPPWADGGVPGIDFIKWIDPNNNRESTGVVCRFTTSRPDVPKGHFRITFISHSELLCALADGYESGVEDHDPEARKRLIRETLADIRKLKRERDAEPDGVMVQLLDAWRRLSKTSASGARIRDLDTGGTQGGEGWDEFVEECIADGTRPKLGTSADSSDLRRFVSLLWGGDEKVGTLWFRLHADLAKLQRLHNTSVSAVEVCKPTPTGQSLIDVEWLDQFESDEAKSCSVHGAEIPGGEPRPLKIKKASLVALARELVLPIEGRGGDGARFDVIDFPGARAPDKQKQATVEVLKRGKLNRLFLSGIEHLDSSVLCLVASCAGNINAAEIVRRAIRAWLEREQWQRDGRGATDDLDEAPKQLAQPPMVLAMTKVDTKITKPEGVEGSLRIVRDAFAPESEQLDWMTRWHAGTPFKDVFWVYNPEAVVGTKKAGLLRDAESGTDAFNALKSALSEGLPAEHMADRDNRLEALFGDSEQITKPLADRIAELARTAAARRGPGLAGGLLDLALEQFGVMESIYLQAPHLDQVRVEKELAVKHLAAIRKLSVVQVSDLLQCLTVSPDLVKKAWKRAIDQRGKSDSASRAAISFDDFYRELQGVFQHEFEARSARPGSLWRAGMPQEVEIPLVKRLSQVPATKWFRDAVRAKVEPLLERMNSAQIPKDRLAAVVSAHWNRCMTWLDSDAAPLDAASVDARPTLRGMKAWDAGKETWNRGIIGHWDAALPRVYQSLIDTNMHAAPWNEDMRKVIERLRTAVDGLVSSMATVQGEHWQAVQQKLGSLSVSIRAKLSEQPTSVGGAS